MNGHTVHDVPTPALVIDLSTTRANVERIAGYCREHGIDYRPHTKTHKSVRIATLQKEAGAIGLTVAKVGEAEAFADVYEDVLIAYPILDGPRTSRAADLARSHTVRVAVDSHEAVDALASAARRRGVTIGIEVDLDTGCHRTGLQTPEQVVSLARHIDRTESVRGDGLFTYFGHVHGTVHEQGRNLARINRLLEETVQAMADSGLPCPVVSAGSTPTAPQTHLAPAVTELRCGANVYFDHGQVTRGYCRHENCAARVVATVVSHAVPGKCIIDAGSKALTQDLIGGDPKGGHGFIEQYPAARIARLTEEHGEVDLSDCDRAPSLGERVSVIPNHICPVVNLFDQAWVHDGGEKLAPLPINARGRLS